MLINVNKESIEELTRQVILDKSFENYVNLIECINLKYIGIFGYRRNEINKFTEEMQLVNKIVLDFLLADYRTSFYSKFPESSLFYIFYKYARENGDCETEFDINALNEGFTEDIIYPSEELEYYLYLNPKFDNYEKFILLAIYDIYFTLWDIREYGNVIGDTIYE